MLRKYCAYCRRKRRNPASTAWDLLLNCLSCLSVRSRRGIYPEIETLNSKLKTDSEGPTDIEILQSVPGVGPVVLATIIGETSATAGLRGTSMFWRYSSDNETIRKDSRSSGEEQYAEAL